MKATLGKQGNKKQIKMEELKQIFTDMLDHIDEHGGGYHKPEWTNARIANMLVDAYENRLIELFPTNLVETDKSKAKTDYEKAVMEAHNASKAAVDAHRAFNDASEIAHTLALAADAAYNKYAAYKNNKLICESYET